MSNNPKGNPDWLNGHKRAGGISNVEREARQRARNLIYARTKGGDVIMDFMINVMNGVEKGFESDNKSRMEAANFLANRLLGKATTHIDLEVVEEQAPITDMRGKGIVELRAIIAEKRARIARRELPPIPVQVEDAEPTGDN